MCTARLQRLLCYLVRQSFAITAAPSSSARYLCPVCFVHALGLRNMTQVPARRCRATPPCQSASLHLRPAELLLHALRGHRQRSQFLRAPACFAGRHKKPTSGRFLQQQARGAATRCHSGAWQGHAMLALVLAATVLVAGFARLIALQEQHLRTTFTRVDFGG